MEVIDWILVVLFTAAFLFCATTLGGEDRAVDPEKKYKDDEDDWLVL